MSSSEVKVGAITLGGAAILAAMITFLGTFSFGSDKYDITIYYPQVAGLMEGNMVRYAGVQVGTVKGLAVNEDGIEVLKFPPKLTTMCAFRRNRRFPLILTEF